MQYIGLIAGKSGDALVDELHKFDIKVALVAGKDGESGTDAADSVLVQDLSNVEEIICFFRKHGIWNVLIGTGHILAINAAVILKQRGFILSINPEISCFCKDKYQFKKRIEELGYNTPNSLFLTRYSNLHNLDSLIRDITFPCVLKSNTDLMQPQKVFDSCSLKSGIQQLFDLSSEVLIEEYINGNDCTVPVIHDGVNIRSLGVLYYSKAKEYQLKGFENAYSSPMSKDLEEKICNVAINIVRDIGIIGLSRVDYIIKDETPYVLETNSIIVTGYQGSAYPFFKRCGINVAQIAVEVALNIFRNTKGLC